MKYDELSEEVKQKVLKKFHDINIHDEWSDDIINNFKGSLENEFGMTNVEIRFSGFGSQGDGASFTGRIIDLGTFMEKSTINLMIDFDRHQNNYVHKNSVDTNLEFIQEDIEYWRKEKCDEIYAALEDEYDYLISDEAIEETILARDYDFDEEGNLI